MDRRRFG